jgi:dipeptidyl-peptidase-4
MNHFRRFLLPVLILVTSSTYAQQKRLTEAQMLKGAPSGITQQLPAFMGWVDDSRVLINKKPHPDSAASPRLIDCKTGKETPGSPDLLPRKPVAARSVSLQGDDIYLSESGKAPVRLTDTRDKEVNPTLSPDQQYLAFTRNNDLYTIHIDSRKETRITTDGTDLILNGYASWVYYEEILGRASRYRSFWWSPDSKSIAFMRMDDTRVPLFPLYFENGQHGGLENTRYPKAGDPNPTVRIGIVPAQGGAITWADFNEQEDQYFGMPYWKPDGKALWVQWMNRGQDTLKIYEVNTAAGSKKLLYEEVQKTWIDLDDQGERIHFLANGTGFVLKSDKDGWENLYLHAMDGSPKNRITDGSFWSTSIEYIDEAKRIVYFTARRENSTRTDYYRVGLDGKNLQRLSFGEFTHRINPSPGGSYFITQYSNAQTPDRLALVDNKGKVVLELGDSKGSAYGDYQLARTEILRVPSADGLYALPIRITWPLDYDPAKKYPVMINIYGGPNAGTVRDGWQFSGMQQWWAAEGLIQVAMDHRASGHFGKQGINYMHRNLGVWELKDWITIVQWLHARGADPTRVGISGFSYGGYMTCMALTAGADYFTHGLAGGSVTDWQLYDTHYTERFMDTPKENPDGYRNGSVLTHADKYKGLLRIYHGTMDDNVHLQNSLQLVKRLQEQKKHFEFMVYPGGRHGWGGAQNAHSTNENNRFIYRNLLQKDMPAAVLR